MALLTIVLEGVIGKVNVIEVVAHMHVYACTM